MLSSTVSSMPHPSMACQINLILWVAFVTLVIPMDCSTQTLELVPSLEATSYSPESFRDLVELVASCRAHQQEVGQSGDTLVSRKRHR